MPTLVSTGQITIVDQNDARPITAYITANPGPQQVYSKDEDAVEYRPDWTTANANVGLVLTAKVYVGGVSSAVDVTGSLTNRRWSLDLSTAITGTGALISSNAALSGVFNQGAGLTFTALHDNSGSTLTLKSNILSTVSQAVIYFEGDYTDPSSGLVSRVVAQITLGRVATGSNAVYVLTTGNTSIENSATGTKNVAVVKAELIRAAGVDTTGVTYQWYQDNGVNQVTSADLAGFGLKTTAVDTSPAGSLSDIGTNLPAASAWSQYNTLVIHENAISDMEVFRVKAKDAAGIEYQAFFTIYDVSDPYDLRILSSAGDKLQNGVGSTTLTPQVWNGDKQVTDLTGWTFTWYFYQRDGKRGAFIDTSRTAAAAGRGITANTAGSSSVITYDGTAITGWTAGMIVKCVLPSGVERFYEVASATGNTVTIQTPSTNTWLDYTAPSLSELVGGKFFAALATQTTNGAAGLTVTGYEVDVKARILCEANRP